MTAKTYGSELARAQLRTLIDEAMSGKAESIIERHGKPAAVLISYDRWLYLENERELKQKRIGEAQADFQASDSYPLDPATESFARQLVATLPTTENGLPTANARTEQAKALAREERAYIKLHPQLKTTHLGHYVAIYQGKLLDEDATLGALVERVRSRYPQQVVWMTQVKDEPIQTIIKRGNRLLRHHE